VSTVRFKRWVMLAEPDLTARVYAAIERGGADACGCAPCRNFAAARAQIYPPEVLALFAELGIDSTREAEIYHVARITPGRHSYGGWFHFVGALQSGNDSKTALEDGQTRVSFEPVTPQFAVAFTSRVDLVPAPFERAPLLQLEFAAEVPWLLPDAKEPR
jgi:hypothetical protein